MAVSVKVRRWWRSAAYVTPLVLVIGGALVWSSYATFAYAEGRGVPGSIAWALPLALDGTVAVTTPAWLSTRLPRGVRNYAGSVCVLALAGSMAVNAAETDWVGLFPPLIAGALIHLMGVVLRAFAALDRDADSDLDKVEDVASGSVPGPILPVATVDPPSVRSAAEAGRAVLNRAYAEGAELPSGAEITAACRVAGFEVNDNYGRSLRAAWLKKHPGAREAVTV